MKLIKDGTVYTMAGQAGQQMDILIDGGKISKIGKSLEVPEGAQVINASGRYVFPGFIDAPLSCRNFWSSCR